VAESGRIKMVKTVLERRFFALQFEMQISMCTRLSAILPVQYIPVDYTGH
jgi:hypothetical protein